MKVGYTPPIEYGFNTISGYGFASGEGNNNFCILQGTDNTWYGATLTDPAFGTIDPTETVVGQTVYAIKWNAAGDFAVRLGDLGNEPAEDTDIVGLRIHGTQVILTWDIVELRYTGTDIDLATELIAEYQLDKQICGYLQVIPNLFISHNFNVQRGTA